jgi:NAD(P)-dependent dehydrogenase (short-subunit alcohol dehydrogenase family)
MAGELAGRAALVTGGGSGIGLASARRLIADGALVTICGRTDARLKSAAAELGDQARWVTCDVTDEGQVAAAIAAATEVTGGLEIVVAAAGGSDWMGPIVLTPLESWRSVLDMNLTGTFLCLKHSAPVMARGGGGSFVAVSSIAAPLTHRYLAPYCVAKAGIETFVRVAADELGPSDVRVNVVRPGLIDTDLVAGITAGGPVLDDYLAQTPLGRVGTVDDVAEAVRYLAGPESSWVTGQAIGVDGGHTLRRGPDYTAFAEPVYGADSLRGLLTDEREG